MLRYIVLQTTGSQTLHRLMVKHTNDHRQPRTMHDTFAAWTRYYLTYCFIIKFKSQRDTKLLFTGTDDHPHTSESWTADAAMRVQEQLVQKRN